MVINNRHLRYCNTPLPHTVKNLGNGILFIFFCKKIKNIPPILLPLTPFCEAKTVGWINRRYFNRTTYTHPSFPTSEANAKGGVGEQRLYSNAPHNERQNQRITSAVCIK